MIIPSVIEEIPLMSVGCVPARAVKSKEVVCMFVIT
jgi:hypothetical protein